MPIRSLAVHRRAVAAIASLVALATAGAVSLVTGGVSSAAATCVVSDKLVLSCGALWGGYVGGNADVRPLENSIGRQFDVVHAYHDWSNTGNSGQFPTAREKEYIAGGRIMFFAWTSNVFGRSTVTPWADIAAGKYDTTVLDPQAARFKAMGATKVFLDFDHEMDGRTRVANGTAADYVRAYRHIRNRLTAQGVRNVVWVWTPTGGNLATTAGYYPGDAYVDWIGYDPYNFYTCNGRTTWKDVPTTFGTFYRWLDAGNLGATAAAKPRMLSEYGSHDDPANASRNGNWYRSVPGALQTQFPKIRAVLQFSSVGICDTRLTGEGIQPGTLAGFADAGRHAYVNAWRRGTVPTADTTAPSVRVTAPAAGSTVGGTVTVRGSAADNVGVVKVNLLVDGVYRRTDATAPFADIRWDTRTVANGRHTVQLRAFDAAGNSTLSAAVAVYVRN